MFHVEKQVFLQDYKYLNTIFQKAQTPRAVVLSLITRILLNLLLALEKLHFSVIKFIILNNNIFLILH